MSQPQSLEKLEKLLEQQRGAGDVRGQTRPRVRQSAPQRENGEGASATAPTAEMPGAKGSRADGTKEEEEDVSDCYTVRHSGFWKRGGLSGLALDEDWGCTEEGTRCSNGRGIRFSQGDAVVILLRLCVLVVQGACRRELWA
jgi:hypothetical protein